MTEVLRLLRKLLSESDESLRGDIAGRSEGILDFVFDPVVAVAAVEGRREVGAFRGAEGVGTPTGAGGNLVFCWGLLGLLIGGAALGICTDLFP